MTKLVLPPAVTRHLRDSAGTRSATYFGSMVGVLLTCLRLPYDPDNPFDTHVHPRAFPAVVAITDLFTRLRPEDRTAWTRQPSQSDLADLARGIALGAGASAAVLGVGMAKGWMSAPNWGWNADLSPELVVGAIGVTSAQEAMLVFNEEQIFRGYGLDTLQAAVGVPAAVAISVALFARSHGPGWKRFFGLSAAGLFLALLRIKTGNLWLAAGFHYGWNIVQRSIFGPEDGAPSLRPLHLHGPTAWVGRPAHPEPGWLHIIATLLLVGIAGLWLRRGRNR